MVIQNTNKVLDYTDNDLVSPKFDSVNIKGSSDKRKKLSDCSKKKNLR